MIVVISKDDYGTPVVFVECWGSPQWWCWWVDVSEKPTKRRGRTKKLRREEMLMKENVKFKIGKRIWKVESSSPSNELPQHTAQGPVKASKRPASSLSQDSTSVSARKQPRRWVVWYDNNMILLFRSSLLVPGMASINQQPQLATNGRAKMSWSSVAALPSLFRPAPGAKSPCKSELNTAARFQVFQSVTSCLESNTADRRASQRMRMRPTLRLLDRPWWRSRGPRPRPSWRWLDLQSLRLPASPWFM